MRRAAPALKPGARPFRGRRRESEHCTLGIGTSEVVVDFSGICSNGCSCFQWHVSMDIHFPSGFFAGILNDMFQWIFTIASSGVRSLAARRVLAMGEGGERSGRGGVGASVRARAKARESARKRQNRWHRRRGKRERDVPRSMRNEMRCSSWWKGREATLDVKLEWKSAARVSVYLCDGLPMRLHTATPADSIEKCESSQRHLRGRLFIRCAARACEVLPFSGPSADCPVIP